VLRSRAGGGTANEQPPAPPGAADHDGGTEVVRLLSVVHRRMQRLVETSRADAGLPLMSWQLLHHVDRHPGVTLGELARACELSKGRTSVLVDSLERRGYVVKSGDPVDGRLTRLHTTERMQESRRWHEAPYAAVVNALMNDLDDWERGALVAILRRVRESALSPGWLE
jgi:DNA-binding MarR family transcriptional regulator